MITTKVEKKAVYQDVIVSEERRCDRCGRHLWHHTKDGHKKPGLGSAEYYNIVTVHHDWGRDSIESVETYDVCIRCAKKMFEEYIEDSYDKTNSLYFECSHERTWDEIEEEKEEEENE